MDPRDEKQIEEFAKRRDPQPVDQVEQQAARHRDNAAAWKRAALRDRIAIVDAMYHAAGGFGGVR